MANSKVISHIEIEDSTDQVMRAVEVSITLKDGSKRWCFFHSPETIKHCGDFLTGTKVRFHYGARHMFVVSTLTEEVIRQALIQIDVAGK
ncbi:hypothetical protein [Thalassomonas sp. RHCl1]|uniref:hypothetical protein n=1 Tax=Thalassomonas sp. RHCl1 TaxID=2995320 RepID=UPI00248C5581|nr:hypothetical protein [Thalassomonas sp. RHCl1]